MKNKLSIDIVVPCGRPNSIITKRCINQLIKLKNFSSKINIYVSGPVMKSYFGDEIHYVTTNKIRYPSICRNLGGFKGKGEYILFVDDDCFVRDKCFKKLLNILKTNDYGMIAAKIKSVKNNLINVIHDYTGFSYQQLPINIDSSDYKFLFVSAFLCVKREIFENVKGFDENLRYFEDSDFVLRCNQRHVKSLYAGTICIEHHHSRTTLFSIFKVQYLSGLDYYKFSNVKEHNLIYLFKTPISSLKATISTLIWNWKYFPSLILYSPIIYLVLTVHIFARNLGARK